MSWMDLGPLEALPLRGARKVKTDLGCVGIFRTEDDKVFAVSNSCPHKDGPLNEGIVHGHNVTCPLHNWVFNLETGQALGADDGQLETYPTRVENGHILLDVSQLVKARVA